MISKTYTQSAIAQLAYIWCNSILLYG